MSDSLLPRWLSWAREIQALAQTGDQYALNDFQRERYQRLAAIAAEIVSEHTRLPAQAVLDIYLRQPGYATPRVDVRGVVFQEGKLLLVQERMDGGWTLPGGWADVGDVPSEAAQREVWEEAGLRVQARRLIGVYDGNRSQPLELFHAYKLVFWCDVISGEAQPGSETLAAAFFGPQEIPEHLSGERTRPRHIRDAFYVLEHPECPTVFD